MRYRPLGNSGAVVSTYAIGTMTFGAEADEQTSHLMLDDHVAAGGNLVDTADVYAAGASEEIIGRWIAQRPTESEQIVLATKGHFSRKGVLKDRHVSPPSAPRPRRIATPPRGRTHRPLPAARLRCRDAVGGDVAFP